MQRLIREVEAREGAVLVMRERMANSRRERERLEGEVSAASGEGKEGMQKRIEALDARAQEQEAAIVQAAQALAECESTLKARETELAALEAKAEEAKARVIHEMSRLSDVKSEQGAL